MRASRQAKNATWTLIDHPSRVARWSAVTPRPPPTLVPFSPSAPYRTCRRCVRPPFARSCTCSRWATSLTAAFASPRTCGQVLRTHAHATGLAYADDVFSFISADASPLAADYLARIHPSCDGRGYAYLFLKALGAELVPAADHLIVLDPDVLILDDVYGAASAFGRRGVPPLPPAWLGRHGAWLVRLSVMHHAPRRVHDHDAPTK